MEFTSTAAAPVAAPTEPLVQDDVVMADSLEGIQEDAVMTQAPALGKRTCDDDGDSGNKKIKPVEAVAEDPVQEDAIMAEGVNDDGDSSVLSTSSFDCRDLLHSSWLCHSARDCSRRWIS